MFQSVIGFFGAPFAELAIFILLVAYSVIYRHDRRGVSVPKIVVLLIIFIYFAWMPIVWPSLIPASMLTLSLLGMFVVNFYFLYSLIQVRIEQPYRKALVNLIREPEKREIFRDIWSSGRRYYYFSNFFQSLVSGVNPFHFLSDVANERN